MKSIKEITKCIPFSSYFKKVDPSIKKFISLKRVKAIPVIITFKHSLEVQTESRLRQKGFKIKYHLPFINAVTGKISSSSFDNISSFVEIDKIYFDGTAALMGSIDDVHEKNERMGAASFHLNGKGVTAAFIDSGVYPHPDLIKPRNRILGFKDYINEINEPYDDNGHGTACIGAAFGASVDGKFKTAAYDCDIVCAKAFNSLGYGAFSDILAAMQWISSLKEKHNIRVLVLPFGCCSVCKHFDIMNLAAESLWNNGLFVCTCSGNLGPYEASITSPGSSKYTFTAGACDTFGPTPRVARFSSRGPVEGNFDKPDVVMPGYKITALNADIDYMPARKSSSQAKLSGLKYTAVSGTSAAASLTAAAAVLLCQKRPNLSPEDMKGVLKRLCTSINELKTVQGVGVIDIKKIEELE